MLKSILKEITVIYQSWALLASAFTKARDQKLFAIRSRNESGAGGTEKYEGAWSQEPLRLRQMKR